MSALGAFNEFLGFISSLTAVIAAPCDKGKPRGGKEEQTVEKGER